MQFSQIKRGLMAIWAIVGLLACGPEVESQGRGSQGVESEKEGRGSVWIVEGKQGGRLFLCGTIHILREQDYPLAEVYDQAYERSDELILELPPGASQSGALAARMAELGRLRNGEQLEKLIGPEDWSRLLGWAKKRGLSGGAISGYRPWYVSLILVSLEYGRLGASQEHGVEQVFEERAKREGKPGRGLETVEFQLQLFAGMSAEQEKGVLRQTLDELETVEAEYERMIRFWKEGKMDELQALLMREAKEYPELMEAFLAARNRAWLPQLEAVLAQQGRAMVLVGAGHLGGEEGLISLLEGKGHVVRHAAEAELGAGQKK